MVKYPEGRSALILMDTSREDLQKMIKESIEEVIQNLNVGSKPYECFTQHDLLTRTQAAKLLGISLPTLAKYMKEGKLQYLRIGKKTLFNQSQLLENIQFTPKVSSNI